MVTKGAPEIPFPYSYLAGNFGNIYGKFDSKLLKPSFTPIFRQLFLVSSDCCYSESTVDLLFILTLPTW